MHATRAGGARYTLRRTHVRRHRARRALSVRLLLRLRREALRSRLLGCGHDLTVATFPPRSRTRAAVSRRNQTREIIAMKAAVARALGLVGVLCFASAATAQAPPATQNTAPLIEEVVITGSRIAAPNLTSTSPIQVVSHKDIQTSGKTDINDIMLQLPQNYDNSLGQDLGNRTSGLTTAGGVATADLRGLGPNRTLVLVDGIRLGIGSPYTFI